MLLIAGLWLPGSVSAWAKRRSGPEPGIPRRDVERFRHSGGSPEHFGNDRYALLAIASRSLKGRNPARRGREDPSSAPMASTEPNVTTVIVLPLFEMVP